MKSGVLGQQGCSICNTLETYKKECKAEVTLEVNNLLQNDDRNIKELKAELAHYKHKTSVLTEVCDQFVVEVNDLSQKIENLELSNARKMAVLTGYFLQQQEKLDICMEISEMLSSALGVDAAVDDYYTIGK